MSDFSQFYQDGGIFMHAVTLTLIGSFVSMGLHVASRATKARSARHLDLASNLSKTGILLGALGSLMGCIDVFAAIRTVENLEAWPRAFVHGMQIASYTVAWGLMCAAPVWVLQSLLRFRHDRPQLAPRRDEELHAYDASAPGNLRASAP